MIHSGVVFLTMLVLMNIGYYASHNEIRMVAALSLIVLGLLCVAPGFLR